MEITVRQTIRTAMLIRGICPYCQRKNVQITDKRMNLMYGYYRYECNDCHKVVYVTKNEYNQCKPRGRRKCQATNTAIAT